MVATRKTEDATTNPRRRVNDLSGSKSASFRYREMAPYAPMVLQGVIHHSIKC